VLIQRGDHITACNDVEQGKDLINQDRIQASLFNQIRHFDEHNSWYENLMQSRISVVEYLTGGR